MVSRRAGWDEHVIRARPRIHANGRRDIRIKPRDRVLVLVLAFVRVVSRGGVQDVRETHGVDPLDHSSSSLLPRALDASRVRLAEDHAGVGELSLGRLPRSVAEMPRG